MVRTIEVDGFDYILGKDEKILGLITSEGFIAQDSEKMKNAIKTISNLFEEDVIKLNSKDGDHD